MEMLDFVVPALNLKAILPQVLLAITALTVLLVDVFAGKEGKTSLGALSLVGVAAALIALLLTRGSFESAYAGMLMADGFGFFITLIVCCVAFLSILAAMNYERVSPEIKSGEFYCLLLFAAFGMSFMGNAGNLIMVFVALETMSISIYVLAGFKRDNLKSIESALKYFLLGAFASGFLLFGFALVYGASGTLDLVKLGKFFTTHPETLHNPMVMGGIALMTVGFGFKVAMFPFHMWTPDVYEGAPTVVTGFMATGVKAAAFAALVRVFFVGFAPLQADWTTIMWVGALLTMSIGNLVAISQTNIKRMLAYSSIAHAGYILVAFVVGSELARSGILFYLLGYAFANIGAFAVISAMGSRDQEYTELVDFSGIGFKFPFLGLMMTIFLFSMAGIPPAAGFMGKFFIFSEAIKSGYIWLAIFGVINSVISLYYYLGIIVRMYFREPEREIEIIAPAGTMIAALSLAAFGVLQMGMFPSYIWNLARESVKMIM
ncbi:MAG: NADH-quinone oxidoreductase subunit N [Deltaproteobacteria bacterium]|nr:NADH-quinone oxidoreductase subunit N [Deltaproteobacteria bacterium]